ncbi:hypothetical protein EWM64_g3683 [Hericium alpestre]|uniref:Uncharacterized protein n=1 Tax=Hericium alpestre TaxID=135208 RepID=A0A4Y9ZZR6_9AGAM|nr:hypothetical protein EWM64_g3683 [Hericium alpestre]
MASWTDIFSLILVRILLTPCELKLSTFEQTIAIFVGTIVGVVLLVRRFSAYISSTKESLKKRGWTISSNGVSVKTSKRMNREDYLDATQRGFIKAMGSSRHGADPSMNSAHTTPNSSPSLASRPAPLSRTSSQSSGNGNGNAKLGNGIFNRK